MADGQIERSEQIRRLMKQSVAIQDCTGIVVVNMCSGDGRDAPRDCALFGKVSSLSASRYVQSAGLLYAHER